jgi:hypothetical protein
MDTRRLFGLIVVLASGAATLSAHHGTSITYEMDKLITVTGTVDEFDFAYPHPSLFVTVKADKGQAVKWGVEFLPTPAALKRLGWNKASIKVGDTVVMGCHPSKSGKPVCALQTLTINGKAASLGGGPGGPPPGAPAAVAPSGQRE